MNNEQEFLKSCYAKYQLNWMMRFGYSMDDFVKSLQGVMYEKLNGMREDGDDECIDNDTVADAVLDNRFLTSLFEEWESKSGFNGDKWVSIEDFETTYFRDYDFMENLLSGKEFNTWKEIFAD